MKKIILFFLLVGACGLKGQILKPFIYGVEISGNSTSFTFDPNNVNMTPGIGYGAAAFCRLKILMLYAELEAGYSGHNVGISQKGSGADFKGEYTLNGLDVSGILGWRIIGIGQLGNLRLFAGYNYNNYTVTLEVNDKSENPQMKSGNQSLIGGLGFDIWKFVFNFKYHYGLDNISTMTNQEIKTGMAVFALGFKIN